MVAASATGLMKHDNAWSKSCYVLVTFCMVASGLYFVTTCNGFNGSGCQVCLWDRRQLKQLWQWSGHQQAVSSCAFLPSSFDLASYSERHDNIYNDSFEVRCKGSSEGQKADSDQQQTTACLTYHQHEPGSACSARYDDIVSNSPADLANTKFAGKKVATASADGSVRVWQHGTREAVNIRHIGCTASSMPTTLIAISADTNMLGKVDTELFVGDFQGCLQ